REQRRLRHHGDARGRCPDRALSRRVAPDPRDGLGGRIDLTGVEGERDGILRLHGGALREHPVTLPAMLDEAARRAPARTFLVERAARRRWRQIGFATAAKSSRRIAAALR